MDKMNAKELTDLKQKLKERYAILINNGLEVKDFETTIKGKVYKYLETLELIERQLKDLEPQQDRLI